MEDLTTKEIGRLNFLNIYTKAMGFGTKFQEIIDFVNSLTGEQGPQGLYSEIELGTPVNAVNATKALSITGVVIDGETVTIDNPAAADADVYEFLADTAQSKTTPTNIAVNITTYTAKASRVLTVDTQPTAGDTMTIGVKTFTFVPVGTANGNGEISIGADLAAAKVNIVAAINGTDSINTVHTQVSAGDFSTNDCTITALVGGVAGNAIATTETFSAGTNIFAGATLTGGTDCTAPNAVTALVAAITASDTQGVGGVDGTGDVVDLTADVAGVVGNAIVIGETLTNGAFAGAATLLSGGVDGTSGTARQTLMDSSYVYFCTAINTTADKNWRRVALGSAY